MHPRTYMPKVICAERFEVFRSPYKDWNTPELVCFSNLQTPLFPFHDPLQDSACTNPSVCGMGCKPESINCDVYMGDNLRVGPQGHR